MRKDEKEGKKKTFQVRKKKTDENERKRYKKKK